MAMTQRPYFTERTPEREAGERQAQEELWGQSNWGQWGPDDELGAVNYIDADAIKRGVAAVRVGKTYVLGFQYGPGQRASVGRPPSRLIMAIDGGDYQVGAGGGQGGGLRGSGHTATFQVSDEFIMLAPHGLEGHLDALSHVWYDGLMYNGHPGSNVRSTGTLKLGL